MKKNKIKVLSFKKVVPSVYFSIGYGGINFSVIDAGHGPSILIESSQLGNNNVSQTIHTDTVSLEKLGKMLIEASKLPSETYSEEYVYYAHVRTDDDDSSYSDDEESD